MKRNDSNADANTNILIMRKSMIWLCPNLKIDMLYIFVCIVGYDVNVPKHVTGFKIKTTREFQFGQDKQHYAYVGGEILVLSLSVSFYIQSLSVCVFVCVCVYVCARVCAPWP